MEAGFLEGFARRRKQHHGPNIARGRTPMMRKKSPQARMDFFLIVPSRFSGRCSSLGLAFASLCLRDFRGGISSPGRSARIARCSPCIGRDVAGSASACAQRGCDGGSGGCRRFCTRGISLSSGPFRMLSPGQQSNRRGWGSTGKATLVLWLFPPVESDKPPQELSLSNKDTRVSPPQAMSFFAEGKRESGQQEREHLVGREGRWVYTLSRISP